ncbi:hypothetical protein AB4238_03490 [Shewanella sp. 10N.286.45.A1]|uniref:hypothetical protein n=1 Tax=Shewanella sp. 10N.286.45.A1 TaxID=3229694 RepID=UPI00354D75F3
MSQLDIKPSFIKELIGTNNYSLLKHNLEFMCKAYDHSYFNVLLEQLNEHEYLAFFNELNSSVFDGGLSSSEINNSIQLLKINAHEIFVDEFDIFMLKSNNALVFSAVLEFHFKLQHVVELILTEPEDLAGQESLLHTFRCTQEKKQQLTQELELLDIGSDEYIHTHELLLAIESELLQIAKEVKVTKEKSNLAAERISLFQLLQPLQKLGMPYSMQSLDGQNSIKTLYSQINKILECLASQYFSLPNGESESLRNHISPEILSQLQDGQGKTADFDLFRFVFLPKAPDLKTLHKAIELALIHLNDLLKTLDPENAAISKIVELPKAHKNAKNFRLYKQGDLAILSTRKGTKVLEFQSMAEAEVWSRQFQLLNSNIKIIKGLPVPKKTKVRRAYSTPALGKRTLVVGNANASTICKTCNGTGLWGNCRSCDGKGFF